MKFYSSKECITNEFDAREMRTVQEFSADELGELLEYYVLQIPLGRGI